MSLIDLRHLERAALCETLNQVGPDAPTLCSQWSAAEVAAHLVASERYMGLPMVVAYGLRRVLPAGVTRRGMEALRAVGDRQIRRAKAPGWQPLLERLAAGPPAAYRLGSIAPIRLIEEWIHHEDIRRANDMGPRPSSPELDEALWQAGLALTGFAEFLARREGICVVLPDGRSHRFGDETRVRLEGAAGELLLFLAGRTAVAQVAVSGGEHALAALSLAV